MILKYKVPKQYLPMFQDKKVIYCKVLKKIDADNKKVYLVRMLNHRKRTNVFADDELIKINLIDRIKLLFIRKGGKLNASNR